MQADFNPQLAEYEPPACIYLDVLDWPSYRSNVGFAYKDGHSRHHVMPAANLGLASPVSRVPGEG